MQGAVISTLHFFFYIVKDIRDELMIGCQACIYFFLGWNRPAGIVIENNMRTFKKQNVPKFSKMAVLETSPRFSGLKPL